MEISFYVISSISIQEEIIFYSSMRLAKRGCFRPNTTIKKYQFPRHVTF